MTTSPAPRSPPAKRFKPAVSTPPAVAHLAPQEVSVSDAPVKALFTEPTASASTSTSTVPNGKPKKEGQPKVQNPPGESKRRKKGRRPLPERFSAADVMFRDVRDFLGPEYVDEVLARRDNSEWEAPEGLGPFEIVEVTAGAFTVSGESLSLWPGEKRWAIVTPFAHPGDRIRVKIYKHDRLVCYADLIEILEYSETYRGGEGDRRKNPEGGCKYYGECGGCQLQPLPYALQLQHKLRTVDLAYQRFSTLPPSLVPAILPTIGSPKQWGYRTKITPHFDAPPKWARKAMEEAKKTKAAPAVEDGDEESAMNAAGAEAVPTVVEADDRVYECTIGFGRMGKPGVMDIEECPIATPVLNKKMTEERARVKETIWSFTKGATILLRDAIPAPSPLPSPSEPFSAAVPVIPEDAHIAVTNHKEAVYERVGDYIFSFAAGQFFQNNNSILVPLTTYVKEAIFPPGSTTTPPTHLVDTYCGSGLFGITLSDCFEKVAGVEISHDSIEAAKRNAGMNGLQDKTTWLCGKAEDIFGGLPAQGFAGDHSCVITDPPRKGCDEPFLDQLLNFKPLTIVYVSCNVHTQARDVGYLVNESAKRGAGEWKYVLESLRGFDLFPQTAHVEGVAVLRLV
ncbi:hypothetical protein IAT38_002198 [Cryptococcus sp. DSM 104549]